MTATRDKVYNVGGIALPRPFKLRRLGHFGLNVRDTQACLRFYRDLLGFKLSDVMDFRASPANAERLKDVEDTNGYFLHYGTDHHAFVLFPRGVFEGGRNQPADIDINQITWQVGTLAEAVNAVDYFGARGVHVVRSGRDMPGSNWHTYALDPDAHTIELYYGMEQIGWDGRSKPRDMYYRKFRERPELPQPSEEAEVGEAMAKGIDVHSGHRDQETMLAKYDVGGVLLPRPFKVTRIGPVGIFVRDVEASLAYYRDTMGFVLTEETHVGGHRCVFLRVGAEHHSLALFPRPLRDDLGLSAQSTLASFGTEVGSYEQLRNASGFLGEHGVEIRELPAEMHPGIDYAAYAIDPDGHCIQLYYYMEQVGWQGAPRRPEQRRTALALADWPDVLEPLSDTYADQTFQGPLG